MVTFKCTYCGETLSVPEDKAGEKCRCPKCGGEFLVPGPGVAAPPPTSASAGAGPEGPPVALPAQGSAPAVGQPV